MLGDKKGDIAFTLVREEEQWMDAPLWKLFGKPALFPSFTRKVPKNRCIENRVSEKQEF